MADNDDSASETGSNPTPSDTGSTTAPGTHPTTGSLPGGPTTGGTSGGILGTTSGGVPGSSPSVPGGIGVPTGLSGAGPVLSSGTTGLRATARTLTELQTSTSLYTKDTIRLKYAARGSKETTQWVTQVTTGIEAKLSMVKNDAIENDQLESVYDLAMRVTELKTIVEHNGLIHGFDVYGVDAVGRPIQGTARNLLDDYGTITLDEVLRSTRAVQTWETDHRVWLETLLSTLLQNSCDAPLRERITERLLTVNQYERGGATYFKLAIMCITSMSQSVSMSLSLRLSNLTIKAFDGEDVPKVIGFLRGAIQRLRMSGMMPPHMSLIVYRILQSSSNTAFNAFFAALYAREEADVLLYGPSRRLTVEQLFTMGDGQFRTLSEAGNWSVSSKRPSAFSADGSPKPLPPWKTPPKDGAPTQREFKGRPEYWCGKGCGWNRTHLEAKHLTKGELKERRATKETGSTNPAPATAVDANAVSTSTGDANRAALEGRTSPTSTSTTDPSSASANAAFLMTGRRS